MKKYLINLLVYTFGDSLIFFFVTTLAAVLWNIYFLQTNSISIPKVTNIDVKTSKSVKTSENYNNVIVGLLITLIIFYNYNITQKFNAGFVLLDAINLANNIYNYSNFIAAVFGVFLISTMLINKQNIYFSAEYLLFVFFVIFFSYLLVSSTNLLVTVFLLELIALLIFGKFTVSKIVSNKNKVDSNSNTNLLTQFSYSLLNSLFLQFWANFISSIFLFFSLINIHYICGTSNFFMVNYIFNIFFINSYYPEILCTTVLILFTTGLFIKLGVSPYQFFKIETYKGIPLFFVIVYTTLYLIVYIHFFTYLYIYLFPSLKNFVSSYIFVFMFISVIYLFSLLFDTKNFKAFLSYSTLITVISLFTIILLV